MTGAKKFIDKFGYKPGMQALLLDVPAELTHLFAGVEHRSADAGGAKISPGSVDLALAFIKDRAALSRSAKVLLPSLRGEDAKVWLAYPKKSGPIKTDLSRDAGWEVMIAAGWIVVSIVAVDSTWSAVRFRPARFVQSLRK